MELQIALLDLLKQEKELVDEINKTGYDATYYEKRAKEHKAGETICDMQAALDDLRKARRLLEEEVRLLGRLKDVRVRINNYFEGEL
jgi:lipid II:glycine glycyltransferase (peptidoglycan interpeptide bridge formation enzyme)